MNRHTVSTDPTSNIPIVTSTVNPTNAEPKEITTQKHSTLDSHRRASIASAVDSSSHELNALKANKNENPTHIEPSQATHNSADSPRRDDDVKITEPKHGTSTNDQKIVRSRNTAPLALDFLKRSPNLSQVGIRSVSIVPKESDID